jgi:hypothetical protein
VDLLARVLDLVLLGPADEYSFGIDGCDQTVCRVQGSTRVVEKRTYVFIFVPFNLAETVMPERCISHKIRLVMAAAPMACGTDALFSTIADLDRALSRTTSKPDLSDDRELNYDLMWTWFLPNPAVPTEECKRKWFKNSNAKTRRTN